MMFPTATGGDRAMRSLERLAIMLMLVAALAAPFASSQLAVNPAGSFPGASNEPGLVPVESGLGTYGANAVSQRYLDPGNSAFVRPTLYAVGSEDWLVGHSGQTYGGYGNSIYTGGDPQFGVSIHGPRAGLGAGVHGGYDGGQGWYLFTEPGVRMMTRQPVDGIFNGVPAQGIGADSYFDLSPLGLNAAPALSQPPASPQPVFWEHGAPPWSTTHSEDTAGSPHRLGQSNAHEPTADQIHAAVERRRQAAIAELIESMWIGQRQGAGASD